jgi:hypothetical protein
MVMPDLPEFQAPDGTIISGRVAYNRYCKERGVTNPADFKEEWAKAESQRNKIRVPGSGYDSDRRRAELARNYKEFPTYGEYRQMIENIGRRK